MTLDVPNNETPHRSRAERVLSHALVEVRQHPRWWPFGVRSAVLLDISETGFKIEFTGQALYRGGEKLLMEIPLHPFGILAPRSIILSIQIVWFDSQKMRCGGVFLNPSPTVSVFLQKIMRTAKMR
jgi:hypothetical protein